jgi:DNA polymerase-1
MPEEKIIILIDASALIYRAYYALPPLTTKDRVLVNAAYGFTSALLRAIKDFHPEYLAVAFDSKQPTFRHKEYKEYKSHRPKAPEDLISQLPYVREVCKVLNMPILEMPGYEADDIIGTISTKLTPYPPATPEQTCPLAKQSEAARAHACDGGRGTLHLKTIIVTGDMDVLQLVNKNTQVFSMARGVNQAVLYDEKKVQEKYGFAPRQLVDYKALRGDPSDNIPGVPGIGEKTAQKLVQSFDNIENLYKKIQNSKAKIPSQLLKPKTIDLLTQHKNQAFLSKYLATIKTDVPIDFDLKHCVVKEYNQAAAIKLFNKLEFKSLINRLPEASLGHRQDRLF